MDQSVLERLGFVKYLHSLADEHAQKPDPIAAVGLLMAHDAAELFLQLAVEYLDVQKRANNFMEYWEVLRDCVPPDGLTRKEGMRRLNKARANFKHHGIRPSSGDLRALVASTYDFIEENTYAIFAIQLTDVTLSALVEHEYVRGKLQAAEELISSNEPREAAGQVALGFHVLMSELGRRSPSATMDKTLRMELPWGRPPSVDDHDLATYLNSLHEGIEGMQQVLRLVLAGVDLPRLWRFKSLVPQVFVSLDRSNERVVWVGDQDVTAEDARFCLNFAVQTALRLQERSGQSYRDGHVV